jgi:hypothetical protein
MTKENTIIVVSVPVKDQEEIEGLTDKLVIDDEPREQVLECSEHETRQENHPQQPTSDRHNHLLGC